ncbi:MAG: alanine--glyoxylate aminotransferase family protein [Caldilineae bacterium]|nr:MAG: alanine--glyoxylate aminotransferase family protein [Caldilineae bacterium]
MRPRLMIPGPIEFTDEVMAAMGQPTKSHVDPDFVAVFGQALRDLRKVFLAGDDYQPFILAGSGTLAMDSAIANLVEEGDGVLVVDTGYFSERMADICRRYGGRVDLLSAAPGDTITPEQVAERLNSRNYELVTVTHVDTSTGVLVDVEGVAKVAKEAGTLVVVDGVCATAGEEMRQAEWGVDVYLTASQKAIGTPPGLALLVVSPEALAKWRGRRTAVGSYYGDWGPWLPIMEAYEGLRAAYFATPAVNLVEALAVSLKQILDEGMEQVFARHRRISDAVKAGISALGLEQVPTDMRHAAHTLTCPRYPPGVDASFLKEVRKAGAILAGGLHPKIKTEYFRIGHMGAVNANDALAAVAAVEAGLRAVGYAVEPGVGLAAAQAVLTAA